MVPTILLDERPTTTMATMAMRSTTAAVTTTTASSSRVGAVPRRLATTRRGPIRSGKSLSTTTTGASAVDHATHAVFGELAKGDDSVVGPVVCVLCAVYIGGVFFNGSREIKAISEELTGKGYDVSAIQKLKELRFLKRAVDSGNKGEVQEAFDKIWFARAKTIAATGDIVQVRRMSEYWQARGVRVKQLSDLDTLQDWMVKKYNKQR